MRIGSAIIFHLSKVWKAKFFILGDVTLLVRLQEKFDIDHSWEWGEIWTTADEIQRAMLVLVYGGSHVRGCCTACSHLPPLNLIITGTRHAATPTWGAGGRMSQSSQAGFPNIDHIGMFYWYHICTISVCSTGIIYRPYWYVLLVSYIDHICMYYWYPV